MLVRESESSETDTHIYMNVNRIKFGCWKLISSLNIHVEIKKIG